MKIKEILNEGKSVADLTINYNGGNLYINDENLTSLKGSPQKITGDFSCYNNKLITLDGGPQIITGNFYCYNNKLTTLEDGPISVFGSYNCRHNKLISLKGAPEKINRYFDCDNNNLTTLEYAPKIINGTFWCQSNKIISFKNIFKHIQQINGDLFCIGNPIKEGLLHILLIKGINHIVSPFDEIDEIINNYLKTNKSGTPKAMFDVQKLIISAKLKNIPESVYME